MFTLVGTIPATSISYTDTGLSPSTEYYYKVRSYRTGTVEGDWSSIVSAATNNVVQITVNPMTEWDLLSSSLSVEQNTSPDFAVNGTYSAYAWYLDGIAVGSGAAYTFNAAGKKAGDVYELAVVVTNSAGEQRSGRCRITITN
jgi:hypothetical protein